MRTARCDGSSYPRQLQPRIQDSFFPHLPSLGAGFSMEGGSLTALTMPTRHSLVCTAETLSQPSVAESSEVPFLHQPSLERQDLYHRHGRPGILGSDYPHLRSLIRGTFHTRTGKWRTPGTTTRRQCPLMEQDSL